MHSDSEQLCYLVDGINQLALTLSEQQITKLMLYLKLLDKWYKVYSLTAISKPQEMIDLHLLDGLSILTEFDKIDNIKRIIDIGSGMGVPGIILAICRPNVEVCVLDSNQKKTAFLQQVKIEVGLSNLQVITHRVESFVASELFDIAISRAFADTSLFVKLCQHLVKQSGIFLAMKGQNVHMEIANIESYKVNAIEVKVPHLAHKRFIIKVNR